MLIVTKRPEASSRMTHTAERCDIPLDFIAWAQFRAL